MDSNRPADATGPINPQMVILGRQSRGLSQTALADLVGVTQGRISKIEAGLLDVPDELLDTIARTLDYPPRFFRQGGAMLGVGIAEVFHRKRADVPQRTLEQVYAQIDIRIRHIQALLRSTAIECAVRRLDVDEYNGEVEQIAQLTRAGLRLPRGPIDDLVLALEDAGVIVVPFDFGTRHIDAISRWLPNLPPIFFVNTEAPKDRLRFSLAHELGHIVMHAVPNPDIEAQADRFAAEFLLPARDVRMDLVQLTIAKLAQLKRYWKVSMAALLKRAQDLRAITANQARYLWAQMAKLGYRTREPVELDVRGEEPQLLRELVEAHRADLGYSLDDLRDLVALNAHEFRAVYLGEPEEEQAPLRLVPRQGLAGGLCGVS